MTNPTLCIHHSPCQDGFGSAWAVWKRFGDNVKYHAGMHGVAPPDVTGEHVVMVDFSYKSSVLRQMAQTAASITILDHHKSAEADLAPLLADRTISGIFDMTRSGSVITWQYFHPETPVPELLLHIQDRDLWQFQMPHTREISSCMFSHSYAFETMDFFAIQLASPSGRRMMVAEGAAIERKQQKDIAELLSIATREMVIGGIRVPVANLPYTMASDAANILSRKAPFAACYFDKIDARVFSLRSSGEHAADVSVIASGYGGGGHKNAAGFQVPLADLAALGLF